MKMLEEINAYLDSRLPGARVIPQWLPDTAVKLYLLDPSFDDRDLSQAVIEDVSENPPYWIFCWAAGRALAQEIHSGVIDVKGKNILDFGAGCGVVGLAAKLAGARSVTTCDIDPFANQIIQLHCLLNGVEVDISDSIATCARNFDMVLAADVLYEIQNLVWLDQLQEYGMEVIVADSRQKNLNHPDYRLLSQLVTKSFPDFAEAKTFNVVKLYISTKISSVSTTE